MTRFLLLRTASLATLLVGMAAPALTAEADARLLDEAKALFRVELADISGPQRCEYWAIWDPDTQGVALEALGETPAPAPAPLPPPQAVIDLPEAEASAFCALNEQLSYRRAIARELDAAHPNGFVLPGRRYSFPVFNRSFTVAALLATTENHDWQWTKGGLKLNIESWSTASELFVKKDGAWCLFLKTRISEDEVFSGP